MQARQHLEQSGLAAARGTDQRHELACLDVERRLGDGEKIRTAGVIDLLHAGEVDERFAHGSYASVYDSRASRTTSMRSSASTSP
jgi:hypothetical protein